MAITTDSYQNIQYNGSTVSQIGLSKTLDNYTWDEIFNFQYCSMSNRLNRIVTLKTAVNMENSLVENVVPLTINNFTTTSLGYHYADMTADQPGEYIYPDGMYCKILWLQGTRSTSINYGIYNSNKSNFKIVTEWDAPKFIYTLPDPQNTIGDCATSWSDSESDVKTTWSTMAEYGSLSYRYVHDGTHTDISIANDIYPYIMFKYNDHYYLHQLRQSTYQWSGTVDRSDSKSTGGDWLYSIEDETVYSLAFTGGNVSAAGIYTDSARTTTPQNPYNYRYDSTSATDVYANADNEDCMFKIRYGTTSPSRQLTVTSYFRSKHASLLFWAGCGLKFYADKLYKPVISDGYVTDYTDDMSTPSELDNWSGDSNHTVPDGPPSPAPSGDDEDNTDAVNTAGAPYAKGLVNYYAMTAGSVLIDHISEALSTWDLQNTGKDLYKNLVSCKLIKPPAAIPTTGSEPLTIYGEKPQYQGADITLPVVSGNPDASFGPYSISRKFNDFRDYAPYTRVSIYLPYCGWCDLPSHVVGRSVSVKYFTDIIAATVRAVVFCNNNIIAEAAGVMGLDIPFTADAVGMKQAGVLSGLTAYAGGALQTAAGVASIVTTKGGKGIGETLSGVSKLVSAYTQTAMAFNENTTEISGKNGDGCCLSGATNIIIKIIRPKYGASSDPPYVPAGFAHSVGFVSNKQVRVGNVSGLLIADNVDTSGIAGATDAERAEIRRVLETGLIVNAAPE